MALSALALFRPSRARFQAGASGRKYQIFVSSTYEDLRDECNEVVEAGPNMDHIPFGMGMCKRRWRS